MPPTTIRTPPPLSSFTPLAEHQSATPSSFYGAKPVLHYHVKGAKALYYKSHQSSLPIFSNLAQNGVADEEDRLLEAEVDVYVNSENLTLFSPSTSTGLSIPYPSITLHAIQTLTPPSTTTPVKGLYTNLDLGSPEEDDEFPTPIELTLILPPSPTSTEPTASADPSAPAASQAEPIQALFEAISACSNLHPDAYDSEDNEDGEGQDRIIFEGNVGYEGISGLPGAFSGVSDGGLPPPFPGSGGWITAENVSEYFDEEGNWLGGEEEVEELGEGAGRVRGRDEVDAEAEGADALNGVNGDGYREDGEGGKRARME